ncbi:MAG: helix-turn-helix transcriptional regulator [Pseudomonadota bacterium]
MTKAPDEIDAYIGARLKMRRQAKGMSQEQLGHEISLTFQQVQKYEKGLNRIGAGRLFHIAEVLGVDVGYFYEGLTRRNQPSDGSESDLVRFFSSSEGRTLARAFSRIDNGHTRTRLIELVRTIAESESLAPTGSTTPNGRVGMMSMVREPGRR